MSDPTRDLLTAFENLSPAERQEFTTEFLRCFLGKDEIAENAYAEIGSVVFQMYDEEEKKRVGCAAGLCKTEPAA